MSSLDEERKARVTIINYIMSKKNYYDILGVPDDATGFDIKKAYRALALLLHPDKTPESESERAEQAFKVVNGAYAVLSDIEKRAVYDNEQTALRQKRERQERERQEQDRQERERKEEKERESQRLQEELTKVQSLLIDPGLSRTEFWLLVGATIGVAGLAALCYFSRLFYKPGSEKGLAPQTTYIPFTRLYRGPKSIIGRYWRMWIMKRPLILSRLAGAMLPTIQWCLIGPAEEEERSSNNSSRNTSRRNPPNASRRAH